MKAIASLIREHHVISRLVAALEVYGQRLDRQAPFHPGDLARFARVFVELGDQIHHEKEENILLPLLSRQGFDWTSGVLSAVRKDHHQERYLIEVLSHAAQRAGNWSTEDRRRISATAKALVAFQRSHHQLENHDLFPEMARRLGEPAQAELQAALERFDAEPQHEKRRSAAIQLADELVQRYACVPGAGALEARVSSRGAPDAAPPHR
jgi:hemerythrin-like domain-containing protein